MTGQLPQRGCPAQVIVPPLLHDRILQALKLQHVRVLGRREDFQPVRLLPDPNLSPHLELPPPEPAPGCEALRVPPAQLPVLKAHLLHRVLHHHVRTEGLEFVGVVHDPAPPPLARIRQEAVLHLGSVQVHHLEVPHVHSPVRVLARGHELHQVPRFAFVQQVLRGVDLQLRAPLIDALISVVDAALHLVALIEVLLFLIRLLFGAIERAAVLQLIVAGKYVGHPDPWTVVRVQTGRVHCGNFCVT